MKLLVNLQSDISFSPGVVYTYVDIKPSSFFAITKYHWLLYRHEDALYKSHATFTAYFLDGLLENMFDLFTAAKTYFLLDMTPA